MMKKFLAVALATVMVLSVSSVALASGATGGGNCPKGTNTGACSVPW